MKSLLTSVIKQLVLLMSSPYLSLLTGVLFCVRLHGAPIENSPIDTQTRRAEVVVIAATEQDGFGITHSGPIARPNEAVFFDDAIFVFSVRETLKGGVAVKTALPVVVPLLGAFHIDEKPPKEAEQNEEWSKLSTVANGLYRHRFYVLFLVRTGDASQRSFNGEKVVWTLADPFVGFLPASERLIAKIRDIQESKNELKK